MNNLKTAAALLPVRLNSEILVLPDELKESVEEIRLRAGQAVTVLIHGSEYVLAPEKLLSVYDLENVLECASGASVHSVEDELSNGYINVGGGIRLGVCGTAVMRSGAVGGMRELSSLSIRIPREVPDCARKELKQMLKNGLTDILIISPPGGGKTTCLREFIRQISDMGYRVSVADERGEICAVVNGEPQFDTGTHCDIICDAPKAKAAMMLIKAMNPELLAMDEISSREDIAAVYEASGCGVHILATAHAASTDDLYRRRIYRELMETDIFRYCLVIENRHGVRSYSIEEL